MIRNIEFPEIKEVAVAIVSEINEVDQKEWFVYLVNTGKADLSNVMITSRGYGYLEGEDVKTSTLRRFLGDVKAESALKFEPIKEDLFSLNNEYWVSFYKDNKLYDKKYLFTAGSISEKHLTEIPFLKTKGILHP